MKAPFLVACLLALALAGCATPGSGPSFVVPPTDDDGRYVIELTPTSGGRFVPENAEVPAGATVVWVNRGGFHNVEADDHSWSSGAPSMDEWEYERTFATPGTYGYHCEPHETFMRGTLRVVAA